MAKDKSSAQDQNISEVLAMLKQSVENDTASDGELSLEAEPSDT